MSHGRRKDPGREERRRKPGLARAGAGAGRAVPACPIADACGGCALIGYPAAEQARARHRAIRELTAASPRLARVPVEPCTPGEPAWGYRTRARLVARATAGEGVVVGLFRRGTAEPVDLGPCLVHSPAVRRALGAVREWLAAHDAAWPSGAVIGTDLRETAAGGVHVTLVTTRGADPDGAVIDDLERRVPGLAGVAVLEGDPRSSYWAGGVVRPARGPARIEVPAPRSVGGRMLVPVGGFFQAAPHGLDAVHRRMRGHLGSEGLLFDLYCGVGLHGLALTRRGEGSLIGVETSAAAVEAARENAVRRGVAARFVAAPVERALGSLLARHRPRRVVLNPPRGGCRPGALEALTAFPPERAAYLSCNPFTLVRDLERLAGGGAEVTAIVPWDLLPQTDHVEVLALLEWPSSRRRARSSR